MSALIALLGSSAFGSILGGLFAIFNKRADLATKKLELDHEQARWAHDLQVQDKQLELARQEAQGRKDVALAEGEARVEAARMAALAAAQAADKITADEIKAAGKWWGWLLVLASVFNRLVRPIATVVLAGAAIQLSLELTLKLSTNWGLLTMAQQVEVSMNAWNWVSTQASAALSYWFVARGMSKR